MLQGLHEVRVVRRGYLLERLPGHVRELAHLVLSLRAAGVSVVARPVRVLNREGVQYLGGVLRALIPERRMSLPVRKHPFQGACSLRAGHSAADSLLPPIEGLSRVGAARSCLQ